MSKRRIKFSKLNMAKYISHLDLLRCFQRAVMRSGLPVEYSQGFNPHQKITFALPLPVGVTGEAEFADVSFADGQVTDAEIMEKLNLNLPPDIRVLEVGDTVYKSATIVSAEYKAVLKSDGAIDKTAVEKFFDKDEVVVMKRTKKKIDKPINIMEYIRRWEVSPTKDNAVEITMTLDAGGERNIKPDAVIKALCEDLDGVCADNADICRVQTFCKPNDVIEIFR